LTITVYPGADGTFAMYEDDGRTFDYRKGDWMRLTMAWTDARRLLTLRLAPGSRMLRPVQRTIDVRVIGEKAPRRVVFEGQPVRMSW